jgi:hypothetical protein
MIRLIGVLTEGGVPVTIDSYVETEGEMIIGALISAAKTLCDVMGSGEVKKLAFKENTLIVTDSKKGYTVVALVDKAEDYTDSLLRLIADEIDNSDIPPADGTANDFHISVVKGILHTYIRNHLDVSLPEIVSLAWTPILDAIQKDPQLNVVVEDLDQRLSAANLGPGWKVLVDKTPKSLDAALEYALNGEYDLACASTLGVEHDTARIFTIKMGQLALSMSSTSAPPLQVLRETAMKITGEDVYCRLGKSVAAFLTGDIPSSEYTAVFRSAAESFEFADSPEDLLYSFLFMDARLSFLPDFSMRLAEFVRNRAPVITAYVSSIRDRNAIFEKLYSVSSYDDFKDTMGFYKTRIEGILEQIRQVLKTGLLQRFRKGERAKGLALQASLQLQNYITLLTALAESPVLTISERKEVLSEVLDLYWNCFRRLMRAGFPIFAHTIDSVFQSLGVVCAEYYYLATGKEREEHVRLIGEFLHDIIGISGREWGKSNVRFSIFVVTNALATILLTAGAFREESTTLLYLAMKTTDIEQIDRMRDSSPENYATSTGNLLTSLASAAYRLLSEDIRGAVFSEIVLRTLDVQQWFVGRGIVCRDDIITASYHTAFAVEMLSENELRKAVKVVIELNHVAVQNPEKYDYEVAMTGSSVIGVLSRSWERLGNPKYLEQAREMLRISAAGWRRYGFYEKADNLEKKYGQIMQ